MSLTITFWDVQHGNATYINTPNGKNIIIDLGVGSFDNSNKTFSPLAYLRSKGVRSLDGVIITHPHTDHLDDIFNFDSMSPHVLIRPRHLSEDEIRVGNQTKDKNVIDKYLEINNRYTGGVDAGENPFDAANNGGVTFQYFTPSTCGRSNLNNHSIVTVVSYAGLKVLIPGDNQNPSWIELLAKPGFAEAIRGTDVLLAPHHGREEGFCEELFESIGEQKPRLTVVSDGSLCDTSAHDRYRARTHGWDVHYSNGDKTRYCLTTNSDGVVRVAIGPNNDGGNFLDVRIYRELDV
jgi:competence protein ComEC